MIRGWNGSEDPYILQTCFLAIGLLATVLRACLTITQNGGFAGFRETIGSDKATLKEPDQEKRSEKNIPGFGSDESRIWMKVL